MSDSKAKPLKMCRKGHLMTPANSVWFPASATIRCRACLNAAGRRRTARKRGERDNVGQEHLTL